MHNTPEKTLIFVKTALLFDQQKLKLLRKRISSLKVDLPKFTSIDSISADEMIATICHEELLNSSFIESPVMIATFVYAKLQTGYSLIAFEDLKYE